MVWDVEYDIYGNIRSQSKGNKDFIPFRNQGQYEDVEVNLFYNRFRYYSAESGAYISQDPIGLAGNNPNMYALTKDTNTRYDPFGLSDCSVSTKGLDHDLAIEAKNFRKKSPYKNHKKNVAVIEYMDGKQKKIIAAFSQPQMKSSRPKKYGKNTVHAEEHLIDNVLVENGIPFNNVTRIYSELDYCESCSPLVKNSFSNLTEMSYTFNRKTEWDLFTTVIDSY